jgi:hypothetical protein
MPDFPHPRLYGGDGNLAFRYKRCGQTDEAVNQSLVNKRFKEIEFSMTVGAVAPALAGCGATIDARRTATTVKAARASRIEIADALPARADEVID